MKSTYFSDLPTPIAIIGMGITGISVKNLLLAGGVTLDHILTFDEKASDAQFHSSDKLVQQGQPKTLVVSPGVPLKSPWILDAKKNGLTITSELSLAYRLITSESLIAITGSVGKSTTTCLLRAALEKFCSSFFVGGNLGTPLAIYAKEILENKRPRAQYVVLELSSYQLENFPELKADYSIITYFTANHLERYTSKQEYYETKWALEKHTKKTLILNSKGGELRPWTTTQNSTLPWVWTDQTDPLMKQYSLHQCELLGAHNQDNIALAAQILHLAQWPDSAYLGLREFPGLPHRVENLGVHNRVRYINDSKATTMESVKIAVQSVLDSLTKTQVLHLLLGGKDKNLPWHELSHLQGLSQIQFYFFGECRDKAKQASQLNGNTYSSMLDAAKAARKFSVTGDAILLSPGGTSLDEFKNFEHRGDVFKKFALNDSE
jgi:UDP-N-acetylmuramoylalanine--D-glutamate ligase